MQSLRAGCAAALIFAVTCTTATAQDWIGRPLADVLRDAGDAGVRIIFTDQLVLPELRVDR
jgi:hypothetical protein